MLKVPVSVGGSFPFPCRDLLALGWGLLAGQEGRLQRCQCHILQADWQEKHIHTLSTD